LKKWNKAKIELQRLDLFRFLREALARIYRGYSQFCTRSIGIVSKTIREVRLNADYDFPPFRRSTCTKEKSCVYDRYSIEKDLKLATLARRHSLYSHRCGVCPC